MQLRGAYFSIALYKTYKNIYYIDRDIEVCVFGGRILSTLQRIS